MNDVIDSAGSDSTRAWLPRRAVPPVSVTGWSRLRAAWPKDAAATTAAVVAPGGALLMANVAMYSGLASFSLRPDQDKRLLPIMAMVFSGIGLGAVVFPLLQKWSTDAAGAAMRRIGKGLVACYLLLALAAVVPGFFQYAFNEPLRYAANLCLGLDVAAAYSLYYYRFPRKRCGLWLGFCTGAGLLCWRILLWVASGWPSGDIPGVHPFLPYVFVVHFVSLALLAALSLHALVFRADYQPPPAEPYFARLPNGAGRHTIPILLTGAFVLYLMNGILDIRLFPMMSVLPQPGLERLLYALVIVCSPVVGWLLDREPRTAIRRIMPACCWLFILSPAMAALGVGDGLHDILQTVAAAAQFVTYIVITLALTGLARDARQSGVLGSVMFSMWLVPVLSYYIFRRRLDLDTGTTVLMATVLAVLFYWIVNRVSTVVAEQERAAAPVPSATSVFLDTAGLTPRERETAELLLERLSTQEIARHMDISESTAKKHIQNTLHKFNVTDRNEFLVRCMLIAQGSDVDASE